MQVPVTSEQLTQLLGLVDKLVEDKKIADLATAASSEAHTVLQKAQADVAEKDAVEAMADGQVNVDLGNLQSFINTLVPPPVV